MASLAFRAADDAQAEKIFKSLRENFNRRFTRIFADGKICGGLR
jgi:hypothetical protein